MDGTFFAEGTVLSQDPEHGGVYCVFRSGQIPAAPVRMMYEGYADPFRVHQTPLPQRGTTGVVMFLHGDPRNAIWLGAIYPNLQDAITADASDPTIDYYAHWSGFWSILDASGTLAAQWPDGSHLVAGSGTTLPTVYRHTVDGKGAQQRQAYAFSDRVPNPPPPFNFTFEQAGSGLRASLDGSGNLGLTGGPNASLAFNYGGTEVTIDKSGNTSFSIKSGATFTVSCNGATIFISAAGAITLTPAGGQQVNLG